jgi:O-antigen ligase
VFSLAFELAHGTEFRGRVLSAILYFGFSLSILAIVQNATSDGRIFWLFPSGYREFVLGPFVYRNHYAAFVELILPIALWRALKDPAPALPYATAAAVLHASVIAAASRSGFILASAELLAGLALLARHRGWCRPDNIGSLAAKFVAPLALCAALVGPGTLWARFSLPDPSRVRREVLLSTLSMVRDRPWLGFGLGTWPVVYRQYATFDDGTYMNQAHNDWAQWAAEGGLPMAAVMLAGVAATLVAASSSLWGLGVPVVFAHALVDYPFQQRPAVGAFVFLMLGLVAAESRDPRKAR